MLVLHLDNYAQVPPEPLEKTKVEVARIYMAAGVQTVWVDGFGQTGTSGTALERLPAAIHARVLLLSQQMADMKIMRDGIAANVLGRASRPTARAYILTNRILAVAARRRCALEPLLSRVIAHEVGHLLLPPRSHSATGIMRKTLDMWAPVSETFTPVQRQQMLLALQAPRN